MNIAVIGTGYVGLVTGTCFAEMGNRVFCVDVDTVRIEKLRKGIVNIFEPGLEELVKSNLKEKRLFFTNSIEDAIANTDICFIAVGTPPQEDGSADLSNILAVAEKIGDILNKNYIVINKSTVPVGTTNLISEKICKRLTERMINDITVEIADNPEFLKEGTAVEDFMRPDRIIIGVENDNVKKILEKLYSSFIRNAHPIYFMDIKSAELTKYAANAMLASRISFMNEMAMLAEKLGADIEQIRLGIGSDKRIGMPFLYAGLGYGGSCFPKDVKALIKMSEDKNINMPLVKGIEITNNKQRKEFSLKIIDYLGGDLKDKIIGVWGCAFKPLTDDIREAPSIDIIKTLVEKGAIVKVYDPKALKNLEKYFSKENNKIIYCNDIYKTVEEADCLLLLTEWRQFRQVDFIEVKKLMKKAVFFDGRNQYDKKVMRELGFEYYCIGRNFSE